jgi:hypothetical protein
MNHAEIGTKATRSYQKHGFTTLKRAVKNLGSRVIDRRTSLGKALTQWRGEIVRDLGGDEAVSAQERAVLDLAVKTKLLLDSVDAWLLTQQSLINARKRCLHPIVLQRLQLADALARYMNQLGMKRRAKEVTDLKSYLEERSGKTSQ